MGAEIFGSFSSLWLFQLLNQSCILHRSSLRALLKHLQALTRYSDVITGKTIFGVVYTADGKPVQEVYEGLTVLLVLAPPLAR